MLILNEVTVKVTITDDENMGGSNAGNKGDSEVSGTDAIIAACVEKVMEILNEMQER